VLPALFGKENWICCVPEECCCLLPKSHHMADQFVHSSMRHLLGMCILTAQGSAFIPYIQDRRFEWGRWGTAMGCLCWVYFYLEGLRNNIRKTATRNKLLTRWLDMLGHMFCQHPSFILSLWLLQKWMLLRQNSSGFKVMMLLYVENLSLVGFRSSINTKFWMFE